MTAATPSESPRARSRPRPVLAAALAALLACAPLATARAEGPAPATATAAAPSGGLYDDLGGFGRPITTKVPLAQRWFDQGLTLLHAFNHDEAIRCFEEAARLDPAACMPAWGIAFAAGPHINNPAMDEARVRLAWEWLSRAQARTATASPLERALVEALSRRYSPDPAADRAPLDRAFADAMRRLAQAHPDDAEVVLLAAEAIMDVHPWDLWTIDGKPKREATEEVVGLLEHALAIAPDHPLACHLYIHAVEGSSRPARAVAAADRLRALVPGAGHLVHMPAHIDIRVGRFDQAALANERAIEVDRKHEARFPRGGFYRVYMMHNHHFLAFACMMEGRSERALAAARDMVASVPPEFIDAYAPVADGFMPVVLHVLVRFGRWQEVLEVPPFDERLKVANAVRHYARGTALAALGKVQDAVRERATLDEALKAMDDRPIGNNPAKLVLEIPRRALHGELEFRMGRREQGLAALREAAALEDALVYDEPPDWMQPVRHPLGATLIAAGKAEEAERVFREDLVRFPGNGWSLTGLARALRMQGRAEEAAVVEAQAKAAFARADVKIGSACFCQPGE
jgi:tetratricopeptide (TPR) repeat protein